MKTASPSAPVARRLTVRIPAGRVCLAGDLELPAAAAGVVVFAHGSGSGRHSPRNRYVARGFASAGLATLLLDLLTVEEAVEDGRTGLLRFDVELLARRLLAATRWLEAVPETCGLRIGCFGASTGAAAALLAAAAPGNGIAAVVSRGGRPDLAREALAKVTAPTLLIVGEMDRQVLAWNVDALARLQCEKQLCLVPRATHLFEEPGALEQVAELSQRWFLRHLGGGA